MIKEREKSKDKKTLSQKVVSTLSRISISSREVREVVHYIREINSQGLSESELPVDKRYIFRELAKDGVIERNLYLNDAYYTRSEEN